MALSNWDTLAFGPTGKPCNGIFVSREIETSVELYKNWAYIRNPKMWTNNGSFVKPTIAQFNEGSLTIGGMELRAKRGPQSSIFLFCKSYDSPFSPDVYGGGIGCAGFDDEARLVLKSLGREGEYKPGDWCSSTTILGGKKIHEVVNMATNETIEHKGYDLDELWIGVTPETLSEFMSWLEEIVDEYGKDAEEWLVEVKASKPLRFNQGDAYFARAVGQKIPITEPGKANGTLLNSMIKKQTKSNKKRKTKSKTKQG